MPDFSQFFSSSPFGSWAGAGQAPQPAGGTQNIPPALLAALRKHLGIDDDVQGMTHQADAPNPAAPAVDFVKDRLNSVDLTPVHLPGTKPEDYLRELYRNPDIREKAIDQGRYFSSMGTVTGAGRALKAGAEGVLAKLPIRAASEDLHEVASANFSHGLPVGNKTVPIDTLGGGVSSSPTEAGRVSKLVDQMGGPGGYIRRLIVDDAGNVVEGQHRLEALRQLGVKNVPVSVIKDLGRDFDTEAMRGAIKDAGIRHPDQVHGMVRSALEALHETGGDPAKALAEYEMPPQFQKPFEAAVNAARPFRGGAAEHILGASVTGTNGKIFTAPNHLLAREAAAKEFGVHPDEVWGHLEPDVGRFLTSTGRMVDRTEAGKIADQAGPLFAENLTKHLREVVPSLD